MYQRGRCAAFRKRIGKHIMTTYITDTEGVIAALTESNGKDNNNLHLFAIQNALLNVESVLEKYGVAEEDWIDVSFSVSSYAAFVLQGIATEIVFINDGEGWYVRDVVAVDWHVSVGGRDYVIEIPSLLLENTLDHDEIERLHGVKVS
jgi:hypothetical protein